MRSVKLLACLLVLVSTPAIAQDVVTSTDAFGVRSEPESGGRKRLPVVGVMADAGVPSGLSGSLIIRPFSWVRLHAGGSYNMVSSGLQAGLTLIPFGAGPSLTAEVGHFFEGNANSLVQRVVGSDFDGSSMLQRVGYEYASAHAGLEIGSRRVTFYLHGGISYLRSTVHGAQDALQSASGEGNTEIVVKRDPVVRAFGPSLKLGLIVYVL